MRMRIGACDSDAQTHRQTHTQIAILSEFFICFKHPILFFTGLVYFTKRQNSGLAHGYAPIIPSGFLIQFWDHFLFFNMGFRKINTLLHMHQ